MKRLQGFIGGLLNKKVDATGLAIFRIFYSVILLCEVGQIFYFKELIFDKIPFIESADIDLRFALIIWMLVIVMIIFGFYTRIATILNYAFSLVFIATIKTYEYHMFYVYMGVNFLLIFTSISNALSIDNLMKLISGVNREGRQVSILNYHVFILLAIAFVYFDSVFYKTMSPTWMGGLGMWRPASLPHFTHIDSSLLLNTRWLVMGLGYLTLIFETVFIFTFFRKKWRGPLFLIGVGLHFGIFLEFPIPWFGLGVISIYMLMVPFSWWQYISQKIRLKAPKLTLYCNHSIERSNYYESIASQISSFGKVRVELITDGEKDYGCFALDNKGKKFVGQEALEKVLNCNLFTFVLLRFLDLIGAKEVFLKALYDGDFELVRPIKRGNDWKRRVLSLKVVVVTCFLLIVSLLQVNVTYHSLLVKELREVSGVDETTIGRVVNSVSLRVKYFSKVFFGITNHPVFMDAHMDGYDHIYGVEAELHNGDRLWLPIIDKEGHVDKYAYSFNWVKWTFRVNGPKLNQRNLEKGIKDFSLFWAAKNDVPLEGLKLNIYLKNIEVPNKWEYDFLKKQKEKPWKHVAIGIWEQNDFSLNYIQ